MIGVGEGKGKGENDVIISNNNKIMKQSAPQCSRDGDHGPGGAWMVASDRAAGLR